MIDEQALKRLDEESIKGGQAIGDFLFGKLPVHPGEVLQEATYKIPGRGKKNVGQSLSSAFSGIAEKANTPGIQSSLGGSLGGVFAGNTPVAAGQTAKSVMAAEKPGSAVMKSNSADDDMAFLDKVLEKKFGYEKRGASIRQGMGNADQANAFLYGLGNKMMGLG